MGTKFCPPSTFLFFLILGHHDPSPHVAPGARIVMGSLLSTSLCSLTSEKYTKNPYTHSNGLSKHTKIGTKNYSQSLSQS